jgi:transcription elongation GreA/GreB family factor
VQVGHLVKLSDIKLEHKVKWVFILPVAGGHQLSIDNIIIQTVTPNTPMAQLLLNKEQDDCVNLAWLNGEFEISIVC